MTELRCVTWNVHRARGRDGVVDPVRVVDAIGSSIVPYEADILALQEADEEDRPHAGILDIGRISELAGLDYAHDTEHLRWGAQSDGFLGTILFLRPRITRTHAHVIDLPGHCHRGAVSLETQVDGRACRIVSTHLSLAQPLRILQMRTIGQYLRRRPVMQTILLGDLNEWRPWGGLAFAEIVFGTRLAGPVRRSFPSGRPLLALDRILTTAPGQVKDMQVLTTDATRMASDHLPLSGIVTVL